MHAYNRTQFKQYLKNIRKSTLIQETNKRKLLSLETHKNEVNSVNIDQIDDYRANFTKKTSPMNYDKNKRTYEGLRQKIQSSSQFEQNKKLKRQIKGLYQQIYKKVNKLLAPQSNIQKIVQAQSKKPTPTILNVFYTQCTLKDSLPKLQSLLLHQNFNQSASFIINNSTRDLVLIIINLNTLTQKRIQINKIQSSSFEQYSTYLKFSTLKVQNDKVNKSERETYILDIPDKQLKIYWRTFLQQNSKLTQKQISLTDKWLNIQGIKIKNNLQHKICQQKRQCKSSQKSVMNRQNAITLFPQLHLEYKKISKNEHRRGKSNQNQSKPNRMQLSIGIKNPKTQRYNTTIKQLSQDKTIYKFQQNSTTYTRTNSPKLVEKIQKKIELLQEQLKHNIYWQKDKKQGSLLLSNPSSNLKKSNSKQSEPVIGSNDVEFFHISKSIVEKQKKLKKAVQIRKQRNFQMKKQLNNNKQKNVNQQIGKQLNNNKQNNVKCQMEKQVQKQRDCTKAMHSYKSSQKNVGKQTVSSQIKRKQQYYIQNNPKRKKQKNHIEKSLDVIKQSQSVHQQKNQSPKSFKKLDQKVSEATSNQPSSSLFINQQQLKIVLQQLKNGIILWKHSCDGFKPHQKKMYLSRNQIQLCYCDISNSLDQKKTYLKDIMSIKYPAFGKGIIKHNKFKICKERCMLIEHMMDGKLKTWQFMLSETEQLQNFRDFIRKLQKYWENFE